MLVIVVSIAALLSLVVIVLGCLDCLFKKKRLDDIRISNSPNAQHNPAYAVDLSDATPSTEQVTIEPLPDILAKVSTAPVLRPRITCSERGKQEATLSLISVQRSFPRDHLIYLNEIGTGWFGQAIESEATQIVSGSTKTHVVVKMLKDDASKVEQKQFMEEVMAFRCLEHANLMSLLGQCVETAPYLIILEFAANGNLKHFLIQHKQEVDSLVKKNRLVSFARDVAAGLACLHRHDYVHNDLAARNCLVMADYSVKIGDYGVSDQLYKDEYMNTGTELLPIRWMAPETLIQTEGKWTSQLCDKVSDMWSFGVLLWEICSMGERPYDMLTDEAVLQGVIIDRVVLPAGLDLQITYKDKLWNLMSQCWQDPAQRMDTEQMYHSLEQLDDTKVDNMDTISDFDQKWQHLLPNQGRTSSMDTDLGSRTALAGSFATDSSSPPSSKPSILNGDGGSHGDDVVVDIGGVTVGSGLSDQDDAIMSKHNGPSEGDRLDASISSSPRADLNQIRSSQEFSPSAPQDRITIENEVAKPSLSTSNQTPAKSFVSQAMSTSTPVSQGQNSSTQFFSPASSPGSSYVTAIETPSPGGLEGEDVQQLHSTETEFSLDSQGMSFHELTDATIQNEGKLTEASNTTNNNMAPTPDLSMNPEDEDFSEFVRTSPTAPGADFTDFESAFKDGQADTEHGIIQKIDPDSSTESASVVKKPLETVYLADQDKDVFDDFVTVEVNTTGASVAVTETPPLTTGSMPDNLTSSWLDMDNDLSSDWPIQGTQSLTAGTGMADDEAGQVSTTTLPTLDATVKVVEDDAEVTPVEAVLEESLKDDAASIPYTGEEFSQQTPPGTLEASSLNSDTSLLSSLGAAPGAPPTHARQSKALSELEEPISDSPDLDQLPAQVPSVSDVLEENRSDLLPALEFSSDPFSSVEFLDHEPSLDSAQTEHSVSPKDDEKTEAGPEKVGTPSKNESASAESGIASHDMTESSLSHAAYNKDFDTSTTCLTDSVNHSQNTSSSDSSISVPHQEDFKHETWSNSFRSSLYRCSRIPLTVSVEDHSSGGSRDEDVEQQNDSPARITSPGDSDTDSSSSTSGSGREYVCLGPYDTGQPPPLAPPDPFRSNPIPNQSSSTTTSSSHADFDEHALQLASEIYLSRGLKSPRVFEIPPLETIPEDHPMPAVQEDPRQSLSDTSSMEVRYEDLFGSDGFEWDDYYGDPLVGRDMTSGHQQSRQQQQQQQGQHLQQQSPSIRDFSDWSFDVDSESYTSSANMMTSLSEEDSVNLSTQSEQAFISQRNSSTLSGEHVHCFSDSELIVQPAHPEPPRPSKQTLVSSLLTQLPSHISSSVTSRDQSDFYSLTEQFEVETDSSPEGVTSPVVAKSAATESLSVSTSHSSSSSPPSSAASSPLSPPFLPPPDSQLAQMHCDHDLAVTFDPSMGSGLSLASKSSEIQDEKQDPAPDPFGDWLSMDIGAPPTEQSSASTSDDSQEQDVPGQTTHPKPVEDVDPFGDLLGLDTSPPAGVPATGPDQTQLGMESEGKDDSATVSQEMGGSLIDF